MMGLIDGLFDGKGKVSFAAFPCPLYNLDTLRSRTIKPCQFTHLGKKVLQSKLGCSDLD